MHGVRSSLVHRRVILEPVNGGTDDRTDGYVIGARPGLMNGLLSRDNELTTTAL